jgi:hypothetical protein
MVPSLRLRFDLSDRAVAAQCFGDCLARFFVGCELGSGLECCRFRSLVLRERGEGVVYGDIVAFVVEHGCRDRSAHQGLSEECLLEDLLHVRPACHRGDLRTRWRPREETIVGNLPMSLSVCWPTLGEWHSPHLRPALAAVAMRSRPEPTPVSARSAASGSSSAMPDSCRSTSRNRPTTLHASRPRERAGGSSSGRRRTFLYECRRGMAKSSNAASCAACLQRIYVAGRVDHLRPGNVPG